jgi:hypothetical protein
MTSADNKKSVIVSIVIIVLLGIMFGMCIRGYLYSTSRRFSKMSTIFFGCMGISLLLEMPQSIWFAMCPSDPRSNSLVFACVKLIHYTAVSGFTFCMGIPICVWVGMVTGYEINIFELAYTTTYKTVLHISIALAMVNVVVAIVLYALPGLSNQLSLSFISTVVVSQLLISLTWLCVGISLQRMVANSAVGSSFNVVFSLNVVVLLVFLCDLTRTSYIFMFPVVLHKPAEDYPFMEYLLWNQVCTVLVPYCVGNFLLIRLMTVSLKYEHRIESRLLKSSQKSADSVTEALYITLASDALPEYAEVPADEN